MRCSACTHMMALSACKIKGLFDDNNLMVNCPACESTIVVPAPGPISEKFRMLHDLATAIGSLETFEEARLALEFIQEGLTETIDKQFARCLSKQIDVMERIRQRKAV